MTTGRNLAAQVATVAGSQPAKKITARRHERLKIRKKILSRGDQKWKEIFKMISSLIAQNRNAIVLALRDYIAHTNCNNEGLFAYNVSLLRSNSFEHYGEHVNCRPTF